MAFMKFVKKHPPARSYAWAYLKQLFTMNAVRCTYLIEMREDCVDASRENAMRYVQVQLCHFAAACVGDFDKGCATVANIV